jgi:hypothetical protein
MQVITQDDAAGSSNKRRRQRFDDLRLQPVGKQVRWFGAGLQARPACTARVQVQRQNLAMVAVPSRLQRTARRKLSVGKWPLDRLVDVQHERPQHASLIPLGRRLQ